MITADPERRRQKDTKIVRRLTDDVKDGTDNDIMRRRDNLFT